VNPCASMIASLQPSGDAASQIDHGTHRHVLDRRNNSEHRIALVISSLAATDLNVALAVDR